MSNNDSNRAGRYEQQREGFRAFIPNPLPPNPRIRFTNTLQNALTQADRALARLDGAIQILPKQVQFVDMYIRHEAVLSNKISGKQSSLLDLLAHQARISTHEYGGDVNEVMNCVSAMKYGFEQIERTSVSIPIMREIHKQLLQSANKPNLTPGEIRTTQNWIGVSGCGINDAMFVPPPPSQIEQSLQDLDQFVASDVGLPVLVKIGLVYAQFETIHPFLVGNGRVGRLIVALSLQESKLLKKPILNLSWFFFRNRQQYYSKLQAVRDEGDWEDWLLFFLKAVDEVSRNSTATLRRILLLREESRNVINEKLGRLAANAHSVLDRLFEFPFVSVNEVKELTGTTFAAANTLVARMVECGLLREYTQRHRNRRYMFNRYVELFKED